MRKWIAIVGVVAALACGKKDEATSETSAKPSDKAAGAPKAATPSSPFAEFGDTAAIAKKLEGGAWLVGGPSLGQKEAWEVKGGEITVATVAGEKKLKLEVKSPCHLETIEESGGGRSSTTTHFVMDGDTLYAGLGDAGLKKGGDVLACVSNAVYTLKGGACQRWDESMFDKGKWESKPAECALTGDVFEVKGDYGSKLNVKGNALFTEQMEGNKAEKLPDLAAAKAKLSAK
jgi:hypothetical protein